MTSSIRVGHCKTDETDVYVGRGPGGRAMDETPIGDRGWLGNPHTEAEHGREAAIETFREDFEARIETDKQFLRAVRDLQGKTLGCWCRSVDYARPACHADVIAEWVEKLNIGEVSPDAE